MKNIDKLWFLVPSALIVAAILPLPYGYYTLLRLIVSIASCYIVFNAYHGNAHKGWIIIFGIIAILYNPIIPVHLAREVWLPINFISVAIFIGAFLFSKK